MIIKDMVPKPVTDSAGAGIIFMNSYTDKTTNFPLHIFVHTGDGIWNGSCVVVSAIDKESACIMIRNQLDAVGLENEELDVKEIKFATVMPTVIHVET